MALAQDAKEFVMKWKFQVLGGVLALVLAGGGWFGWQKYTHSNSPEYFLEQLNAALASGNVEELASLVDFRHLTEDLATRILAQPMPSKLTTPKHQEIPLLAESMQNFFLENIKEPKDAPKEEDIDRDSLDVVQPLPVDFITQMAGKFILETRVDKGAIASVKLHYPRFDKEMPFYFYLKEEPQWRLTRLANADDLLKNFMTHEGGLEAKRKQLYNKQREQDRKRIEAQFKVSECTAFIHKPRGQKVPLLLVRIKGFNKGPFTIRNMTFDTSVNAQNAGIGELAFRKKINTAARLNVGTTLEDSYTLELETKSREAQILLEAPTLTCTAKVHFMTLDNGTMLFLAEDEGSITKPLPQKDAKEVSTP